MDGTLSNSNKQISKKIQYNFYLKYLSLVLSNRTKYENYISIHIEVWKIILGISSLNETFDYEKSKQFAKENIPKEIYKPIIQVSCIIKFISII